MSELTGRELEEHLQQMALDYVCAICDAPLITPWDRETSKIILVCSQDRSHQGYRRIKSLGEEMDEGAELPLYIRDNIVKRRKKEMTEEYGPERGGALEPYRGITALTKAQASLVLSTIWPEAPLVEVTKAAWVCASYGLNPLMRHVFLIPFKNKTTGKDDWSIVIGIKANRLIASRKRPYGYVDGPRIMTRDEQETLLGEVDPTRIWALTTIKDESGNQATGYGNWPKSDEPKGVNKGNSKANMAHIRSERAALDRLCPGEMPEGVDVVDEAFIEGDYKVVNEKTGEIIDVPGARIIEDEDIGPEHKDLLEGCPVHGGAWSKDNYGRLFHRTGDGVFCKASKVFGDIFVEACKAAGYDYPAEKVRVDEWLKNHFGGTWSKIPDDKMLEAIDKMQGLKVVKAEVEEHEPPVGIEPEEAPF